MARLLEQEKLDALLVTHPPDWYYFTGFTGDSGALLLTTGGSALVTDGRFTVQAKQETSGVRVVLQKGSLFRYAGEFAGEQRYRRIGFESVQVSVAALAEFRKGTAGRCKTLPVTGLANSLRTRKDPSELAQMRKAAILASEVVESAIRLVKPGLPENELAAEIEYRMRKKGASGPAFQTIVASGPRAALPHARPTAKRLRKNELVVLDLGVILGHYCSDITRTVHIGRASARVRGWYRAVQEAQMAAIDAAGTGVKCAEVDAAAREILAGYKLDRHFIHSTGHGLGLEVHEDPRVAKGQERRLQTGNVITIEPGIYVEGVGGIRIEDDVAIHEKRTEILTRGSRELIEI
jgi:Xaa-Pro aminopeptidase